MKIKLKTLTIESTTAELLKPTTKSRSSTGYEAEGTGSLLSEVYYYETSGHLEGSDMFGVKYTCFIPYSATSRDIEKTNKIILDNEEFLIIDLKRQIRSLFEDHYELIIDKTNQDGI